MTTLVPKPELIASIAALTETPKDQVDAMLRALAVVTAEALLKGRSMRIQGIGTLRVATHKARTGPRLSGGTYSVPQRRVVRFRPERGLAAAVAPIV